MISAMKILLIEDDRKTAQHIIRLMEEGRHNSVEHCEDGQEGYAMATNNAYDVMIIDRMLPKFNGLQVIEKLRRDGNKTPVIILTALDSVDQRVEGLRAGGDDYLIKPYAGEELKARVNALARRGDPVHAATVLRVCDLELDILKHRATRAGQRIDLQPREFRLLEYLMRHAGHVVTRQMLLENVWDYLFDPQTNVIDVQISRLRSKIDKDYKPQLLETVRNFGYRIALAKPTGTP